MRRRVIFLASLFAMMAVAGCGWIYRGRVMEWYLTLVASPAFAPDAKPVPDPEKYRAMAEDLERWRLELGARYKKAKTAADRGSVEHDARVVLEESLPALMRCWLGTPWDFSGTAEGPGKGKIACGYFVATVLKDAGFRVDRYKLAQQPSENIMRSFVAKDSCSLTVGQPYDAFADGLAAAEPGVYIVGLDTHVAFMVVGGDGFRFIHSSGSAPWCVVDEGRRDAVVLRRSNWRMLGNFTGDPAVVRSWLQGGRIEVKGT